MLFLTTGKSRWRQGAAVATATALGATMLAMAAPAAHADEATVAAPVFTAGPVTAEAPVIAAPKVTAKVTAASPATGLTLKIKGTGFDPSTNDGDQGVYVGLAPADADIDFDDMAGTMKLFAAVDWVTPQRFNGDSFVSVLSPPKGKLKKGTKYAVYTWQAHTHSNTTQDTKTAVAIQFAKLVKRKTLLSAKVMKKPTSKKPGRIRAIVKPVPGWAKPAGKVRITLKKGKATRKLAVRNLNKLGRVNVRLPKLGKGQWKATVRYAGNVNYKANVRVVKFRVLR